MSIAQFIKESILQPKLKQTGCLVIYDHDKILRELCLDMASDRIKVIDTSESSIESREAAMDALREVCQTSIEGFVIYVPLKKPIADEQKQVDPFSVYGQCGTVFPQDDGDEYMSICLRAKPDFSDEIRRVFKESPTPPFAVIDSIGSGASWPQLRALMKVESAREILKALLAPSAAQEKALKDNTNWTQEAHEFLRASLMMTVKTRAKTLNALAEELWRYVLFSEFVFDLPTALPDSLKEVPHAPDEAKAIIEDVCDALRIGPNSCSRYIEQATKIEEELNLQEHCKGIHDLGLRDTFPFEERTFLRTAINALVKGDIDTARSVISRHVTSVWIGKGESQAQWELVKAGMNLILACEDYERQLSTHTRSQSDLLDFYVGSLREVERLQREFEQTVGEFIDSQGLMNEVIRQARNCYGSLAEKVQTVFIKHLENEGWPPTNRMANAEVFDRLVSDRLKERGYKVAYLMVDALRYELGVALENMLSEDGPVQIMEAYAQLPSITLVGMASLLPGARSNLKITMNGDGLVPKLSEAPVSNVSQRMAILQKSYGDRFKEMLLTDFVRKQAKLDDTIDLLVLRSTEIDSQLENNPETTLSLIPSTLKQIRAALHKLWELGFKEAIIVTDHGFFLNAQAEASDVCIKPQGKWPVVAHDRIMLGNGNSDSHNLVMSAEKLGIRGDFEQVAVPRSMAPYRAGYLYFHGGISLPEAVVPVIIARLDTSNPANLRRLQIELSYKKGAKRITTRLPVIDVTLISDDIFSQGAGVDILLEAYDSKSNVVGEVRFGSEVNPAAGTIHLTPGERKQIALRMDPDFEGKFSVKALNPTTLTAYSKLDLETDYMV